MLAKLAKHRISLAILAVFAFSLALAPAALAQVVPADDPFGQNIIGEETGLGEQDIRLTIAAIINVALSLLGIVALVIILYGGFKWMTAGGNEESVAEARKIIVAGVIGLAIILSSYAIAQFVLTQLGVATNFEGFTP